MTNSIKILVVAISLLLATVTSAHHSASATFKADSPINVEGLVTGFRFKNPHVMIYVDVKNADGTVTNWAGEGAAATNLRRAGWSKDSFKIGDTIRMSGSATHDGSPMVSVDKAFKIDAKTNAVLNLSAGEVIGEDRSISVIATMPKTLADGRPNLSGDWAADLRDGRRGPPRAPEAPFNETGAAIQAAYDWSADPQVFCDAPGLARQSGLTPHPFRITQFDDHVVIEYDEYGSRREIYFDAVKAALNTPTWGIKSHLGDSIARYENDSLIVETRNLLSNQASPEGNRLSDEHTIVETFRRDDDAENGAVLWFEMVITDAQYLTRPFVLGKSKALVENYQMIENECQQPYRIRELVSPHMSFFVTSKGLGDGAKLDGLLGADQHCEALAESVGAGGKGWAAYLSTSTAAENNAGNSGAGGVNARDRIGNGPWYNAKGEPVARDLANLHSQSNNLSKATAVDEHGQLVNGRGDEPNRHDIITGSQNDGTALSSDADTTCSNWTSNSEGAALAGHHDRVGGGANPSSWNNAHATKGCGQASLQSTGGDGLFYCFATNP